MKADTNNLTGKLLIAMPGMGDPRFEYALVYICAHSGDGAMGLIINKPNPKLAFKTLITQLKIKIKYAAISLFNLRIFSTKNFTEK